MKNPVLIFVVIAVAGLIGGNSSSAAEKAVANKSQPVAKKVQSSGGRHCLWRVTDGDNSIYLLGSVHRLRKSDYPLAPVIEQAIEQSQQFYFEYDPDKDAEFSRRLLAAARLPFGVQIKQKVNPKTWDFLRNNAYGGSYEWTHLRAWAIAHFVLNYPVHERPLGAYGLDNYVEAKARKRKRPMFGLETPAEHVAVFGGMTDKESEVYLLEAIVFASQHDARYREAVAAWKVGSTDRLFALEMPEISDAPGLNPRFLDVRNANWIPKIESALKSGQRTLVVAGAMHFSGPHSVLNMLRTRGYKIEQL